MRQLLFCAILLFATAVTAAPVTNQDVIDNLQNVSVTVSVDGRGCGSGTLYTREVEPGVFKSYVWTAGHVIRSLRYERTVIDKETSTKKVVVGFKDC